jgi:uncharacterized protein
MDARARNLTIVIKSSKLCNLRCDYCYEYHSLSDKSRMDAGHFSQMFRVLSDIERIFQSRMKFCWHGGEPLLLPIDYFEQGLSAQRDVFSGTRINLIQTNLYRLTSNDMKKLRLMDHVSISFDVFGGNRVTSRGDNSSARVAANMDSLRCEGISFGAISVLTKSNIKHLESIFSFFNNAGLSFRVLPYYREADRTRTDNYGLTWDEKKAAMLNLTDLWFKSSSGLDIYPVADYIQIAMLVAAKAPRTNFYLKGTREHVLMLDTNGDVYSPGTAYMPEYLYGNVFRDTAEQILTSSGRNNAIERSNELMGKECFDCPFFGYCSGYFVGEQTELEVSESGLGLGCVARSCIEKAVEWISLLGPDNCQPSVMLKGSLPTMM